MPNTAKLIGASLATALLASCSTPGMYSAQQEVGEAAGQQVAQSLFGGSGGGSASGGGGGGAQSSAPSGAWGGGSAPQGAQEGEIFVHTMRGGRRLVTSAYYDPQEAGKDWFLQGFAGSGHRGPMHMLFVQAPLDGAAEIAGISISTGGMNQALRQRHSVVKPCSEFDLAGCSHIARAVGQIDGEALRALAEGGGTATLELAGGASHTVQLSAAEAGAYMKAYKRAMEAATS